MWSEHTGAAGDSTCPRLSLLNVWDVRADATYDVNASAGKTTLVAVRTHGGEGRLHLRDGTRLRAAGATLLLLDYRRLARYRCIGGRWDFWWLEFRAGRGHGLPLHRVLEVAEHRRDPEDFAALVAALRQPAPDWQRLASAGFGFMLQRWLATLRQSGARTPHQEAIERVIAGMHARLDTGWSVREMARAVHLSPRRFRQVFREATGQSPKRFYDRLRLSRAAGLLGLGFLTVGEVAQQLGYENQFHFSRAFCRHFGVPPSRARSARTGRHGC